MSRSSLFRSVFALCLTVALEAPLHAQIVELRVDGDNGLPTPAGDGLDWLTAFLFLQDALAEAQLQLQNPNVTVQIWVKATAVTNPYLPDRDTANQPGTGDRARSLELLKRLELYGGFAGGETQVSERDPVLNVTVLSGDIGFVGDITDNSFHVVFADTDAGTTARLDGFTITAGNANGSVNTNNERGGGMLLVADVDDVAIDATVVRCIFRDNFANLGGAIAQGANGLLTGDAVVTLINCSFFDNSAGNDGGAMYNDANQALLVNCLFAGNHAADRGGAIFDIGGALTGTARPMLINCTFSANVAVNSGGGIFDSGKGIATLTNCIVWGNSLDQIVDGDVSGTTVTFSDVEDGFSGNGNINVDPEFGPGAANHRLLYGSPCIDAADTTNVPLDGFDVDDDLNFAELTPDLDLRDRAIDDPDTQDCQQAPGGCGGPPVVDMGSYEFVPCPSDIDRNCVVDRCDLIDLLMCYGERAAPDCVAEDVNFDGTVNVLDLIHLLLDFGANCSCADPEAQSRSLEEELNEAGLTMDDWDDFMGGLANGNKNEQDNWICWMIHYLTACPPSTRHLCGGPACPDDDPFGQHDIDL